MSTMSPTTTGAGPGLRAMAGIEARRFARHPLFLLGALATFVVTALLQANDHDHVPSGPPRLDGRPRLLLRAHQPRRRGAPHPVDRDRRVKRC